MRYQSWVVEFFGESSVLAKFFGTIVFGCVISVGSIGLSQTVFLNDTNSSVALGETMAAEPFANRSTADSLASVIDLPTADATELHTQSTHVWISGGTLELIFDFGSEYDLESFVLWNYVSEGFDVDRVELEFFDDSMASVGNFVVIDPAFGNLEGSESFPIIGEEIAIGAPKNVRLVRAVFSGTNGQVDINNAGFTGQLSATTLLGDLNLDGVVGFLDISPFIALLSTGGFQAEGDFNENGIVDFLDIAAFIAVLAGS